MSSKRIKSITLFAIFISSFVSSIVYADTYIPYGRPNIDGNFSPNEWSEMSHIRTARFYGFDQFVDLWLQWDNENLYIAGYLDDYTLFEDGGGSGQPWETWQDDSLELYLRAGDNPPNFLDEYTRILAFSMTGQKQRLDRGKWANEPDPTTGLEVFGNTNPKIGNAFFNKPVSWINDCQAELNVPAEPDATVRYAYFADGTINNASDKDTGWQFELAIPWRLIGTRVGQKITGDNCGIGDAIIPTSPNPRDGMPLQLNFYRVNDDNGGAVEPTAGVHVQRNRLGEEAPDGTLIDEWFVYKGDRNAPNEWATFILSNKTDVNDVPIFDSQRLDIDFIDGHRVRVNLDAPRRGNAGGRTDGYQIRYQKGNIAVNEQNWNDMLVFENAYQPNLPNQRQALEIIGLDVNTTYTIAVRAEDETGRLSREILSRAVTTTNEVEHFVTVAPTGRNLVFTDGRPFVIVGETGLMPWLPLRGLYTGELCDEYPPVGDADFMRIKTPCGQSHGHNGRLRNYSTEALYFICHMTNGRQIPITDIYQYGNQYDNYGPSDNCEFVAKENGTYVRSIEAVEGPEVARDYFKSLKAAGVNTLTVFAESLDLDVTPILFEDQKRHIFNFLDNLIVLAREYDVYLMIRLYDTYYYKDDTYTTTGEKWNKTRWYQDYGKATPEGFFDEDVYQTHYDRMRELFYHVNPKTRIAYRDEPHILGWDLLNEIDNTGRFNDASYEKRKKWVETMVAYAKREAPRQLTFFSFLTWDPKDDASHYRANLGMDAELAYRALNSDIAVAHGYYGHVSNPYAVPPTIDHEGPMELARGTIYGFYQIRDGRPIIDGEAAPDPLFIEEGNAYKDRFTKELDYTRFMAGAWLHFTSGGAGANLHWPIDLEPAAAGERKTINQLPPEKRAFLSIFKNNVDDIRWWGDKTQISHHKVGDDMVQITRHDTRSAVVFLYNQNKKPIYGMQLADLPEGIGHVQVINPRNGDIVFDRVDTPIGVNNDITFDRAINDSVAVVVRGMSLATAPESECNVDPICIRAVFKFSDIPDSEALWKFGGDETKNGNRAVWGYFYANPAIFDWGNENNPEVFVKVWFDASGRIDVNFFHVSGPDIEVFSRLKSNNYDEISLTNSAANQRYARHTFNSDGSQIELLDTPEKAFSSAKSNPTHHVLPLQDSQIGSIIHTEDQGDIEAAWRFGGSATTSNGSEVAWGYFYANPADISWGFENNPEVYVKVWYDVSGRLDVNFFHVSAPDISVYSGKSDNDYQFETRVTQGERYTRHVYE
jgi:hypothetical protein